MSNINFEGGYNHTHVHKTSDRTGQVCLLGQMPGTARKPGWFYSCDLHGLLARNTSLDGSIQSMIQNFLPPEFLYLAHYLKLVGHFGERGVYDITTSELYWPYKPKIVYPKVSEILECVVK